jgi:acyl-CoA synthetase (AMP-forming)/AMP-acid ligase II
MVAQTKRNLHDLLKMKSSINPEAIAISAPGRPPLTYNRLYKFINEIVEQLNALGFGRNDRLALVLPNGPEMAVAFLAVSTCATSAPLNSGYRESEFDFYFTDLNAKALIVQSGIDSPARSAAKASNIPIIELSPKIDSEAGIFTLSCETVSEVKNKGFAQSEDVALVLHTSGTTSRPKLVPLTQVNLCQSAQNIQLTLKLSQDDCCLNVMPLFHIHGLIGVLLSSLTAGASVSCTSGFVESKFFEWLQECQPTWYSAVPTMHQAILNRADSHLDIIEKSPLRFIRSSSASLPPNVMQSLESVFKVPMIEAYGMTEASHQMASNPLPPLERKPGSVGMASGPEVAVMDEAGKLLQSNNTGEIVIRGVNVMQGYENNPEANKSAFTKGWFRTGDQGYLDSDSYLFITGRLKEIINRGGEKISPREVDEALMNHPSVAQAVTFAVPHPRLGEDVAAAVVLHEDKTVDERELRQLIFNQLADFKVPSQILVVDKIPKGPTGKLQRIGLAEKLASKLKAEYVEPRNPIEDIITRIWSDILGIEQVSVYDNFFLLGGDSLMATRMISRVRKGFGIELPIPTIFKEPRVLDLAKVIDEVIKKDGAPDQSEIIQALEEIDELSEEEAKRILDEDLGIRKGNE